jgi:hypothetical protein
MKLFLTLLFLLFVVPAAFAQVDSNKILSLAPARFTQVDNKVIVSKQTTIRICTPSRSALIGSPLVIIYSHDKVIFQSADDHGVMSNIPPQFIKSVNVFKDSLTVAKFGSTAKNGVIEIYLDDEKYPDAYKVVKTESVENKKR